MYGISGGAEPRALVDGADVALGGTEQALFRIAQARSAVGQRPRRDSRPQLSRRASPARRQHYGNRASLGWAGEETRPHVFCPYSNAIWNRAGRDGLRAEK